LQKHEKANEKVLIIEQGKEDSQFWNLFFQNQQKPTTNQLYGNVTEWDRLLIDVSIFKFYSPTL